MNTSAQKATPSRWLAITGSLFLIASMLVAGLGISSASAQTSSASTGTRLTDFVDTLSVAKFDSSLGELALAEVTAAGSFQGRVVELTNDAASVNDFEVRSMVSLCLEDTTVLAVSDHATCAASSSPSRVLFEEDVVQHQFPNVGPGQTQASATEFGAGSGTVTVTDVAALQRFIGADTIDYGVVTLTGFTALGGGGNQTVVIETFADVTLSVRYEYAGVDIDVTTNGADDIDVTEGDPVVWTFKVTNTGTTDLVNAVVADDILGDICTIPSIPVGEMRTCTRDGIAGPTNFVNSGTVVAQPSVNPDVDVDAVDPTGYNVLAPTPTPVPPTATPIPPTATPVPPTATPVPPTPTVAPPQIPASTPTPLPVTLTATATETPTAVPTADLPLNPEPTVPPGDADPTPTPTTPPVPVFAPPAIDVELATNGIDADLPSGPQLLSGSDVVWTYRVVNTGQVDLFDVVVTDDLGGRICAQPYLAIANSFECLTSGTACNGQQARVGDVIGTAVSGQQVTDIDPTHHHCDLAIGDDPADPGDPADPATPGSPGSPGDPDEVLGRTITVTQPEPLAYTGTNAVGPVWFAVFLSLAGLFAIGGSELLRSRRRVGTQSASSLPANDGLGVGNWLDR